MADDDRQFRLDCKALKAYARRDATLGSRRYEAKTVTIPVLTCQCGSQKWLLCMPATGKGQEIRCESCKGVLADTYWIMGAGNVHAPTANVGVVIDAEAE